MTRREISFLQWILLIPCLAFFHPFLKGKVPFTGDILYSFHPWLTYAAQNLQAGHLPLWNSYSTCGEPFLANPQTMIMYPGAIMFWIFPFSAAWPLFMLAHQALLFWAAALLVKHWNLVARRDAGLSDGPSRGAVALAASIVAWGGFSVVHWEFPSATATMPFVALVLLFSLSSQWIGLALASALLWVGGYSQFAIYAMLWSGMAVIWKTLLSRHSGTPLAGIHNLRTWFPAFPSDKKGPLLPATVAGVTNVMRTPLFWLFAVGLGTALAMPQILSSWEVTHNSMRTGIGAAESSAYLLTPVFLIKFLLPAILDKISLPYTPVVFDHMLWPIQRGWLTTFFIGTPAILLGLAGLKNLRKPPTIFLLVSLALFASLATGWEPLFSLLRQFVPGLRYMTHFSNAMGMVIIALAMMIPAGLKTSENPWPFRALWSAAFLVALVLTVSSAGRMWVVHGLTGLDSLNATQDAQVFAAARMSLIVIGLTAAAFFLPGKWRVAGLLCITLAELWIFGRDIVPYTDPAFFHQPVPLARGLIATPNRLAYSVEMIRASVPLDGDTLEEGYQSVRQIMHPSLNLPYRVPFTWGYEVFPLKYFTEFRRTIKEGQESGPQIDFVGGRHIVATKELPHRLMARRANGLLYTNDNALPRATWVGKEIVIPDPDARLRYISGEWKPWDEVVVEKFSEPSFRAIRQTAATPRGNGQLGDDISWKETPGRLVARGESSTAGWLVYSETFYPGWEAYVNGKRVELWKANHAFQSVRTPAGQWEAVLLYRPKLFRWGLMGSLVAMLMIVVCLLINRKDSRRTHS